MADEFKDALRVAAEAAEQALPLWERRKEEADAQIAHLLEVIKAWRREGGRRIGKTSGELGKRHPRGQAERYIDEVLESDPNLTEAEIIAKIEGRFNVCYVHSTIHAVLTRRAEKYQTVEGKWRKVS
ncbi:MAG TPA: hypothetical protein VGK94_00645 [Candidatus Polarisedimenticolia bacterium]|jgi:hypothetical protein